MWYWSRNFSMRWAGLNGQVTKGLSILRVLVFEIASGRCKLIENSKKNPITLSSLESPSAPVVGLWSAGRRSASTAKAFGLAFGFPRLSLSSPSASLRLSFVFYSSLVFDELSELNNSDSQPALRFLVVLYVVQSQNSVVSKLLNKRWF